MPRTRPGALDITIIAVIIAAAVLSGIVLWFQGSGDYVEITTDSGVSDYSLNDDRTVIVSSGGYHYTVEIKDGSVSVTSADCPNKTCVNTPAVSKADTAIVCVPGKLTVKIVKEASSDEDWHLS